MEESSEFRTDDLLKSGSLTNEGSLRIKIVGIGGAGTNAVDRIKLEDLEQVHLLALDTDGQVLAASPVEEKFLLGRSLTRGKSAGGDAEQGREAARSDRETLRSFLRGVDLVFILAGLGGGTGSGAAPVVAELAAGEGALVISFVCLPFKREGSARTQRAHDALESLRAHSHAVIALPNDILFNQIGPEVTLMDAFAIADKWIKVGVQSIWSMLFNTGLINVDFATLRSALSGPGGKTLFGTGAGKGDTLVEDALADLKSCPLLHLPEGGFIKESDQLILHLTGGPDLTMAMVNDVMDRVADLFGCHQSLLMGASIDGSLFNQLQITVMGTLQSPPVSKGFAKVPAASIAPNKPAEPLHADAAPSAPLPALDPGELLPVSPKAQEEFSFPSQSQERGVFEKTGKNLHQGEDLDIPTYLRRGLKIALK
jgi:cell division protein FtsZ